MRSGIRNIARISLPLLASIGSALASGCKSDDVYTEERIEVHEESEPQMVSPGKMIVE